MQSASAGCDLHHTGWTMFCKHCGTKTKEGAKFCAACGKPVAANIPAQQINPAASSVGGAPAQRESRRSTPEPVAPTVEAPNIPEASPKPAVEANTGGPNRNRLMIGIALALILGLAIGAISFYLLRLGPRRSGSISTANTIVPAVGGTASPAPNSVPPTNQAAAPDATSPPSSTCFDLSKQEPHSLTGKLRGTVFADEPGYADVRNGDED